MIDMVHPGNTLKRGFSITRAKDGSVLKSICSVHTEDELTTEVADGVIISSVNNIGKAKEKIGDRGGELWLKRNTASPLKS